MCAILQLLIVVSSAFAVGCVAQTERVVEISGTTTPVGSTGFTPTAIYEQLDGPALAVSDGTGLGIVGGSPRLSGDVFFFVAGGPGAAITPIFGVTEDASLGVLLRIPLGEEIDGVQCAPDGPLAPCEVLNAQPFVGWFEDDGESRLMPLPALEGENTFAAEPSVDGVGVRLTFELVIDTTGWAEAIAETAEITQNPPPPDSFIETVTVEKVSNLTLSFTLEKIDAGGT